MRKPLLGACVGAVLGAVDGATAWFSPDARPIIAAIVVGSTVKGLATGLLAGFIARWRRSTTLGVCAGVVIGFVLSSLAAIGQGSHYLEIVLPGMLVGAMTGFITQRYPQLAAATRNACLAGLLVPCLAAGAHLAAQTPSTDALAVLSPFVGKWAGESDGQPGKGTVERTYERALGNRFIRVRNHSHYPPQERNPKGESHEDEGLFSFDRVRKVLVLRQFHVEGFVNQYVHDPGSGGGSLVFVTEAIENIPAGWRGRETYTFNGADELEEVFELAPPGKDF